MHVIYYSYSNAEVEWDSGQFFLSYDQLSWEMSQAS